MKVKPAESALFSVLLILLPDENARLVNSIDCRYRYPFINCTNCGPRFTMIRDLPYDRKNTTMAEFTMCPECAREYEDMYDRRFHVQPNACPVCGPSVSVVDNKGKILDVEYLFSFVAQQILAGKIIAIKGLGGFHCACDAMNEQAVRQLRLRKYREKKPLAVMFQSLEQIKKYCILSLKEEQLLTGYRRPIVLVRKKHHDALAGSIAPSCKYHGVMLPYTKSAKLQIWSTNQLLCKVSSFKTLFNFLFIDTITLCYSWHPYST